MIRWLETPLHRAYMIIGAMMLQTLYNGSIPLHPDEMYYWVWSRHLALSYYDHPGMIAYAIKFFSFLGDDAWVVRLPSVFAMGGVAWWCSALAAEIFSARVAAWSLLLGLTLPAVAFGATLATPDSVLLVFWGWGMFATYQAFEHDRWRDFIQAGIALGCAMLSKYTAITFVMGLLVYGVIYHRSVLLQIKFWVAALIALVVVSPVMIWNAQHEWVSFAFQYGHGTGEHLRADYLGEYLGGALVLLSPILFGIVARGMGSRSLWEFRQRAFVGVMVGVPFLFFGYKALFARMQLNWYAMICVGAVIIGAWMIVSRRWEKWGMASVVVSLLLGAIVKFPALFHLPAQANIHNRLFGYDRAVALALEAKCPHEVLMADHLTIAAAMSYYAPGHPDVVIPFPTRMSQYSLWNSDHDRNQGGILLATRTIDDPRAHLLTAFVVTQEGMIDKQFYLYRVSAKVG